MEDEVDGSCMVFYEKPVAHILALSIHWKWLPISDVVNEQWDQLLRELIWTVVVRAISYNGWHTISIMVSTNKVIR